MKLKFRPALMTWSSLLLLGLAPSARAGDAVNDFPTVDRVLYVQECMRAHPGPFYEMVNKCSCAADALAAEVKYEEYVEMQTISNGMSIGGERGGAIRDVPTLQPELKKYRALQTKVQTACFIKPPEPK